MPEFLLGMEAKIYQGTAGDAIGALTEMSNVKDVTLNMEAGKADVTSRANSGWRGSAATLRDMSVDFEMVWKPGDTGFDALRVAFLANATIELAILDQAKATTGAQGPKATFAITSFTRSEALEEAITVSVKAELVTFDTWYITP